MRGERQVKPSPSLRRRILFVLGGAALISVCIILSLFVLAGAFQIVAVSYPSCPPFPDLSAVSPEIQIVTFPSSEIERDTPAILISGVSPRKDAVVIALPNTIPAELAAYVRGGYDVLVYTHRACLTNTPSTLGYREAMQVGDAIAYLESIGFERLQIALHGFSAAGAAAMMAAEQFPGIGAVVAEGGYHQFPERVHLDAAQIGKFSVLFEAGAHITYRLLTGLEMSILDPMGALDAAHFPPILLIYGAREPGLEPARWMQAANDSAVLWEVEGAVHGNYVYIAPDEYANRVVTFLDEVMQQE
ncbi:MAG: hypothetical protein IAE89_02865 [Anaerolineae bacterium]|nr:hypothetical protein [Anaerolineae bacterium]